MRLGLGRLATLSSFRVHWTSKTEVKCKFVTSTVNPLVTSCWSEVRNCGKMLLFAWRGLSRTSCAGFIHFGARCCSKTCILKCGMARCCSETDILLLLDEPLVGFGGSMARNCGETRSVYGNYRKHRAKRSFWKLLFYEIWRKSHETLVLEACSVKFRGSLARNARFEACSVRALEIS